MQKPIITVLLLIVALVAATKVRSFIKNNAPAEPTPEEIAAETETVICTMDAMMCPDGSYVGRSGPSCEFKCPESAATSTPKAVVGLNEPFEFNAVPMKVWAVTEDSRCPSDVTCIQAGRVKIALNYGSSTAELEIGQNVAVEGLPLTLDEVSPYPVSTHKTGDEEYRFTFSIHPLN